MKYNVLASNYGCSLIDLNFTKCKKSFILFFKYFIILVNRHLPRLMLSYLGTPILGDPIYVRRLINIDGELSTAEPKDLHRSINKQVIF